VNSLVIEATAYTISGPAGEGDASAAEMDRQVARASNSRRMLSNSALT